jgi:hypothetical protein
MECRTKRQIERAAVHLLQAGWCAGTHESAAPGHLRPLLAHARRCVRCGELLEIFLETERRLQAMVVEAGEQAPSGAPRLLALAPLPETGRGPAGAAVEESEPYELAADSGGSREAEAPTQSRTLTLVTEDDRYLVRIVAAGTGAARAVLVLFPPEGAGDRAPEPRPALRIGEDEYAFDESGVVELPTFPGMGVFLVLR